MNKVFLLSVLAFSTSPGWAALNVPLTVQEARYSGVSGIARTNEPFCQGVPLADSQGITSSSVLGLSGASAGQFRILGIWPSGHAKWVEVCGIIPSLTAGGTAIVTLTDGGAGNFGGSNLATDNGSTITVSTGAATFTVKKAHFNVVDQVVIGTKTVVASGASQGLVVTGPPATAAYPANVTCTAGSCTVAYSSANDPNSLCSIEKNGPVEAVLKCTGDHVDGSGHVYMHFTVREYFHQGKTWVKVTSELRNADYGTSNTFATAYKGHQGYELRLSPNISGTLNYSVANDTASPTTGTVSGTDNVYLYQGESQNMKSPDWCGYGCVPYTTDAGYSIVKNGTPVLNGTDTQYPQGWADISDGNGVGVEIGVYQLAAYWPKSLEFNGGGSDVRIGIWARQNSQPYYQAWAQHSIHDLFLNFHTSLPASLPNEFLKFQHYLVGRAVLSQYNNSGVFPYTVTDPTVEDAYYTAVQNTANPSLRGGSGCCVTDGQPNIFRFYAWSQGGGGNQAEFRWSNLLNFVKRGMTGRYLDSAHFYRMEAEKTFPRADGFTWRSKGASEVNGYGFPTPSVANYGLGGGFSNTIEWEHEHWYGLTDYYFMTGDETIHDALLDGPTNYFLDPRTYMNSGQDWNSRAIGSHLMGAARLGLFLSATGDPADGASVLSIAAANPYARQVLASASPLCVSGYPAGCTAGSGEGVSMTRGLHYIAGTDNQCTPGGAQQRSVHTFMQGILLGGLWELRQAEGPTWSEYTRSLDLAYGISQWMLSEGYGSDGTGVWTNNGFRYNVQMDVANNCGAGEFAPQASETVWLPFLIQNKEIGGTSWQRLFNEALQQEMSAAGISGSDFGQYQIASVIDIINNPGSNTLQNQVISGFIDNGGGQYTISWTVPAGAQFYRIKWGQKSIVDWIGFDPANNVFVGNPATSMNWFAATDVPNIPAPGAAGVTQSLAISTGMVGLTAANFSVKAYVAGTGSTTVGPPATLVLVSGKGQTGTPGTALSNPFTVKVADANGSAVSGVAVTFSVASGGGTLTATQVTTNGQGLASSTLTLGASAGTNTVTAASGTLAGSPIVFSVTAAVVTGTAAKLVLVSGNNQTGAVSQQLSNPFTVEVTDANSNPVSGAAVTFMVTSGGGTLTATQVSTNSQGVASGTLRLGTTAGANTVTATSGALVGSPVTFTASAANPGAISWKIGWTNMTHGPNEPGFNYWLTDFFDPVSQQVLHYGIPGNSNSIYSSDVFFYSAVTQAWTHLGGNGTLSDSCPADTASWPGDRHPLNQMAIDTKRNVLWLWGGVCQSNGISDTYYLQLNPNPMNDTWHKVSVAHAPSYYGGSGVYDPDDDVLYHYGYDGIGQASNNWVYCSTIGNPTPGALTAKQSVAGCANPDDWTRVSPVGGVQPPGSFFAGTIYDPITKKVILYGGLNSGLSMGYNQTWAYDVPTKTWTQKALSTTAPPVYAGQLTAHPGWAYNTRTNKILYHQTSNTGAPADWQYDPAADTWALVSSGSGPTGDSVLSYDATNNQLITFSYCGPGCPQVWQGTVQSVSSAPPAGRCDLNSDGVVDLLDVQLAIGQVLGTTPCGSADLVGNGVCSVIDVQRIVNASLGGTCRIGP
jgi:hypothetical protein